MWGWEGGRKKENEEINRIEEFEEETHGKEKKEKEEKDMGPIVATTRYYWVCGRVSRRDPERLEARW